VTTYEEWRVTGRFINVYTGHEEPYHCTARGLHVRDPENDARTHLAEVTDAEAWTDGPHLHRRTVTVTDWEAIQP
jgi:hypothetical protein